MATQLRLVDPLTLETNPVPARTRSGKQSGKQGTRRASTRTTRAQLTKGRRPSTTSTRRAVRWGEWQLDDRTRSVGRAGVAAAREALERAAAAEQLQHAS
jgi:hypothetical protein